MAIQSSFYEGTALTSRRFASTKHIATKAHMSVWVKRVIDDAYIQLNVEDYQLINNFCVLNELLDSNVYSQIEIRVADIPDELSTSPSDISIVASNIGSVNTVSSSIDQVVATGNDIANINTVSSNLDSINTTSANIDHVKTVSNAVSSGTSVGGGSGGQYHGNGIIKGVEYFAQEGISQDNIVIASGTNAMSVDSFTIVDGGSLTIEDNAVYKVI